ncbi:unnamed protein product [Arctia plantaginis]|uniref:Amino acid transporter transmembrane domain-containing protein n=1 Tax=Arctia plantaginis TaxID=874455 RepID=A0A8S1B427_ARCPL|nr:unnamed protein product [Arctia plantaginis]
MNFQLMSGVPQGAAFEKVSRIRIKLEDTESILDIGKVRLPLIPMASDYDPRKYRQPSSRISPWMAHFNMVRAVCGPGLLGMPVAMSASGLIIGSTFTILSGILLIHMYRLLLDNLNEISRQLKIPYISYRYGFRAAVLHGPPIFQCIGNHGPTIIGIFMIMSQVGICTVCVILTSDSLRDIADWSSNNSALLALLPVYLVLEFLMKNLKRVSYLGIIGFGLNMSGLLMIFYHIFKEPQRQIIYWEEGVGGWLFTWGMCLFNLSALAVILTLDKALKDPKIMTSTLGVINISLGIPVLLSLVFGALGYWAFGSMEENILRALPYDDLTSMIIMSFYIVSVTSAYPLHCYPITGVIEEMCRYASDDFVPTDATLEVIRIICRPLFVLLAFTIAYYFPFQGPFVAFVGNLCTSMLSIVFPAMMDLSLRYGVPNAYGPYNIYLIKDVIIFLLGLIVSLFGVYFCGYLINIRILSNNGPKRDVFL